MYNLFYAIKKKKRPIVLKRIKKQDIMNFSFRIQKFKPMFVLYIHIF